MDLQSINW